VEDIQQVLVAHITITMRTLNEIIVHCTATKEGQDYTVAEIRRWHKAKGWSDIGYHFVVHLDGSISFGRPLEVAGAHCMGHNSNSIGVVYVGGCAKDGKTPKDTRTKLQRDALRILIAGLKKEYGITKVSGHNEYAAKACPSFDVRKEGY
jgi:N-acetylmuramoyl-L-alanine amidase